MQERFITGYNDFVLPFMIGMTFIIVYLVLGVIKVIIELPAKDRKKLFLACINPVIWLKTIKDIICDVLLHVKIWKRKPLLGYMHASIAFGWFMLIVLGHLETWFFVPDRLHTLYYPIFFRYFVMETEYTVRGSFFFFMMDFFLLVVLSGVVLAIIKRLRKGIFRMRRTTRNQLPDQIAMYCLWAIFPLRLLAESFTAGISGGSFLTKPMYWLFSSFLSNTENYIGTWWAYSSVLGLFFVMLPFTRYMHIPTEIFLIILRNAGIKVSHTRKGYTTAQIYSCSNCGMCIDACPMTVNKKNVRYATVYFNRYLRRRRWSKCQLISDKCMMCGKCVAVCPVGVESTDIRLKIRQGKAVDGKAVYNYFDRYRPDNEAGNAHIPGEDTKIAEAVIGKEAKKEKVIYYAGCMTQLTPVISKSVEKILNAAGVEFTFLDRDGGVCCSRPMMLSGRNGDAQKMIDFNTKAILDSGATTLLLSCPICYKVFMEEYPGLSGIRIVHYTEYFRELLSDGRISLGDALKAQKIVYHDPCELGRGCGVYSQPREVLSAIGSLVEAEKHHDESICCGGSIGSLTLSDRDRQGITENSIKNLMYAGPGRIVTACPLCLKTYSRYSPVPVEDFAQVIAASMVEQ